MVARQRHIAVIQALQAMVVALALGFAFSGLRVWHDLAATRCSVREDIAHLMETMREPAAHAAYEIDPARARLAVRGLFEYPTVSRVSIRDDFGTILAAYERPAVHIPAWLGDLVFHDGATFSLALAFGGKEVGELTVAVDRGRIVRGFMSHVADELAANVTFALFFAGLLTFVFYFSLTRPLARIQQGLAAVDPDNPGHSRLDIPKRHDRDEVGGLARTVNRLLGRMEEALARRRQAEDELKAAVAQAQGGNKAKNEFLANMSHEIRTPLNGVLGMLQLLKGLAMDKEQEEYVDVAMASGKSLLRVISDILDFSKMEAGILDMDEGPLDIRETLQMVVKNFRAQVQAKDLRLELAVDQGVPRVLLGDEARLRQVLFNVVGNAVKFTDTGRIRVEVLALGKRDAKGRVRLLFSVSDSGIGIPDDKQAVMFEAFTQVDGSYTRRFQGAGLGLGIVRRIVGLMHGNISVESEPGRGTTIHFTLRLKALGQDRALVPAAEAGQGQGPRLRVLLVEDERTNLLAARHMLARLGHEVLCAPNGRRALETLAWGDKVDVVLMDVQMPEMDGLEATRTLRDPASPHYAPQLPIVAMTAHAMNGDRERFLAAGMDGYISKPVDMAELEQMLRGLVRERGGPC